MSLSPHFVSSQERKQYYNMFSHCAYCGDKMNNRQNDPKKKTIDHIVPRSSDNVDEKDKTNLIVCCKQCNDKKHVKPLVVFFEKCLKLSPNMAKIREKQIKETALISASFII